MEAKVKPFGNRRGVGEPFEGMAAFLTALGPDRIIGLVPRVGTVRGVFKDMVETWYTEVWYWEEAGRKTDDPS